MKRVGTALLSPDQPGLNRLLLTGFAVSILILLATAVISTCNHEQLVSTQREVTQTQEVLREMAELQTRLLEVRDAQRRFIITGQERFLTTYADATNRLGQLFERISTLLAAEPLQQSRFDQLQPVLEQVIGVFNTHIGERRKHGFDAEAEVVRIKEVDASFIPARDLIDEIAKVERVQLARREQRSAQAEGLAFWFNNSGRLLSIVLFGAVFFRLLRENQLRRQRENELRRSGAELERRVAERTAELREKNKELETVVYIVSHDLRSPLINVQGFAKRLGQSCQKLQQSARSASDNRVSAEGMRAILEESIPRSLEFIDAGVKRIDQLLSGFLRYSRLGRVALNIAPLDIGELLAGLIRTMQYQLDQAGAVLDVEPLPACLGDSAQTALVFSNLLDNALKYRDPGRPVRVKIAGWKDGEHSVYRVQDNGLGIAPEHQPRVFEIFHRLNPDHGQGDGLGLTIAQRLLERQQGKIWLESEPGVGSSFFVSLPFAKARKANPT